MTNRGALSLFTGQYAVLTATAAVLAGGLACWFTPAASAAMLYVDVNSTNAAGNGPYFYRVGVQP